MPKVKARPIQYTTWYEFKKDLERKLGHSLSNWQWMDIKPRAPLPWDDAQLKATLSALTGNKE
jgi:hypothetical protein